MPLFRDKSADRLYAHLLDLGVQVELLKEHPLKQVATKKVTFGEIFSDFSLTFLLGMILSMILSFISDSGVDVFSGVSGSNRPRKSLGLIQLDGKSIDYINVIKASGEHEPRNYCLEYLALLKDIPLSSCRAELKIKKRGLVRQKVEDIEWTGDILADKLNGDLTLKENLLKEFQLNIPWDITIAPEPAYRCARIETIKHRLIYLRSSTWSEDIDDLKKTIEGRRMSFPSGNLLDCINRIAGITAEHVKEVNS